MIFNLSNGIIIPGKMAEYYEIVTKELNPLYSKLGMKLAGSFHPYTGNMNEIYALYAFNDLADYQKVREAQRQSKEMQIVSAKLNALRTSQISTILEPNPWSPMK
jgi:hypothetical protein